MTTIRDSLVPTANGTCALAGAPHGAVRADVEFQLGPKVDWTTRSATGLVDGTNSFVFDIDHRVPRLDVSGTMTGLAGTPLTNGVYVDIRSFDAGSNQLSATSRFVAPDVLDGSYSVSLDLPKRTRRAVVTPLVGLPADRQPTTVAPLVKGANTVTVDVDYQPASIVLSGTTTTYGQPFHVVVPTVFHVFDAANNRIAAMQAYPIDTSDAQGHYSGAPLVLPLRGPPRPGRPQVDGIPANDYTASLASLHPGADPLSLSFDFSPPKVTVSRALRRSTARRPTTRCSSTSSSSTRTTLCSRAAPPRPARRWTGPTAPRCGWLARTTHGTMKAYLNDDPTQKVTFPDVPEW